MTLLGAIDRHLARTGISASRFGKLAIGDPRLVQDMRNGRCPRGATRARIEALLEQGR